MRQHTRKLPVPLPSGIPATSGRSRMREADETALQAGEGPQTDSYGSPRVDSISIERVLGRTSRIIAQRAAHNMEVKTPI